MGKSEDSSSKSSDSGANRSKPVKRSHHYEGDRGRDSYSDEERPRGDYSDSKRPKVSEDDGGYRKADPPRNNELEVFVGGLSWSAQERDLQDLFADCGHVENVKILMNADGRSKGAAFVLFDSAAGVEKAIALDGTEHMGRHIKVNKSTDKPPQRRAAGDPNTVFVGNLSYQTTEDDIRTFFKSCGEVKDVRLAKDPEGRPKGFAHVEFMAAEDVDQALKLSGEDLNGRDVKVDFAVRKQDSGFRGRRGYDRPRRGSGFHHYEGARY